MTVEETRAWLNEQWWRVLADSSGETDPEIDRFINCNVASLRFAVVTQLLGKIADPLRDLLCLQKGVARSDENSGGGRWDPRSFCVAVVVPWNQENERVLGGSRDPYVNNPLRRPRLDEGLANVHSGARGEWEALADYLRVLQAKRSEESVRRVFQKCLLSVAGRMTRQRFDYPTPNRVSLDQLCGILGRFLEMPSGGLRAQAAATALMRTLGSAFSIFSRVEGQGINEPDRARNVPGDIMCYGPPNRPGEPEEIQLAVDVKSGRLRLADLQGSIVKARKSRVSSFLFAAPGFWEEERPGMERIVVGEFVQGLNVYVTSIEGLARSAFMLLGEEHRTEFLSAIGEELDARAASPADRKAWSDLLADIGHQ